MSPKLKMTLITWLVEANTKNPSDIVRRSGICSFTYIYSGLVEFIELSEMLESEFGKNRNFPFGGIDKFKAESHEMTAHKNKQRIAWVKDIIAEYRFC